MAKLYAMPSFLEFFETLPDPRVDRMKRHKLSDIVFITIAAVLRYADTTNINTQLQYNKRRFGYTYFLFVVEFCIK